MKKSMYGLILIILVTFGMLIIPGCTSAPAEMKVLRSNMESLDRDMGVRGSFALGSGSVEGVPSYMYYTRTSGGGLKLKSVPADECTIYQDENTTPYIQANYVRDTDLFRDPDPEERGDLGNHYIVRSTPEGRTDWYKLTGEVVIHIPPNSVVKEYIP